jgi:hypothetical protein
MLAAAEILPAPDWPDGWDQRPTIEPDIATIAARLHKALGAVLQGLHKPLEGTETRFVHITAVRLNVVADCRRRYQPAFGTNGAPWLCQPTPAQT